MRQGKTKGGKLTFLLVAVFWVMLWWIAAIIVNQPLFLPSPLDVALAFVTLLWSKESFFWQSIATSLGRIGLGFFLGLVTACLLGWLASAFKFVRILLEPLLVLVRAIPVASFVILALVWFSSKNLSVFAGFLMVLPVVYSGVLVGIKQAPTDLLEMAKVYRLSGWKTFCAVYLPALKAPFLSSVQLAIGMCWKSGIAAEVIGLPRNSIGERLYQSKIYLETASMFAWTAVIILLSWLFSKIVLFAMKKLATFLEGGKRIG